MSEDATPSTHNGTGDENAISLQELVDIFNEQVQ